MLFEFQTQTSCQNLCQHSTPKFDDFARQPGKKQKRSFSANSTKNIDVLNSIVEPVVNVFALKPVVRRYSQPLLQKKLMKR